MDRSTGPAAPSALSDSDLSRRLRELCGEERHLQVEFLLHLDVFDRRRGWAEAGYGSLWAYCLEVLHLRESSAGRRIAVMKLLRRFPALEAPLRDGRLSLSTVDELGAVLTDANFAELVERAAFRSIAETRRLVASIQPQPAPADGVRRLASRSELRPVTGDTFSLRVTLDAETNAELERLVSLLSHTTNGDLAAVVKEAIRCAVERHGKRKGAVVPERKRAARPEFESLDPRGIPMDVRRVVWDRDGGCCAWTSADGKRCGSTWKLEFGHVTPVALGGRATVEGVRLECRAHNVHEAIRVFGARHMAPYLGESAPGAGSHTP
jgi:hypothetical protein